MKTQIKYRFVLLVFLGVFSINMAFQGLYAQEVKKNRVRLKLDYVKVMEGEAYLDISASAKIDKQNVDVSNITIEVFNEINDEEIHLGDVMTNMNGESRFIIKDFKLLKPDSTKVYTLGIAFKGNDLYKRASKSVSFRDAEITARIITKDSTNFVTATLKDISLDSLLVDHSLDVQVQRLFSPLKIGEEFNNTDENGTILVPVEDDIPGVDGVLTLEVVLNDSDDYGTVKALITAPIGIPIVEESTYDQRTLWSPRDKTPISILVFANLLIFGIWGMLFYLMYNLFKISKS
jgi:hypothetical protein